MASYSYGRNWGSESLCKVPGPMSDSAWTRSRVSWGTSALSLPKTCSPEQYYLNEVTGVSKSVATWSQMASPGLILQGRLMGRNSGNPMHYCHILVIQLKLRSYKVASYKCTSVKNFCTWVLCRLQTHLKPMNTKGHVLAYLKVLK